MRTTSGFNQSNGTGFTRTPEPTTESWWMDYDNFYAEARRRHPELARKYGSAPVITKGVIEPTFSERARRRKENERDRLDRMVS